MIGDTLRGRIVRRRGLIIWVCLTASLFCGAQQSFVPTPPVTEDARPVPVLSGGVAFIPTWDAGQPTLVSIVSPVVLVPLGSNFILESRGHSKATFSAAMETQATLQERSISRSIICNSTTSETDMSPLLPAGF